jgi:acetyl-CoA/propionyl-CoA carboxylase biotin carboxyl carrier protein
MPMGTGGAAASLRPAPRGPASRRRAAAVPGGNTLTSPMQGTVVKIAVSEGQVVAAGDTVFVVEAMKMEQPVTAHRAGAVGGIAVSVGDTVTGVAALCDIRDPE